MERKRIEERAVKEERERERERERFGQFLLTLLQLAHFRA